MQANAQEAAITKNHMPRRAQPLLLLSRSNPPTEGGGEKNHMLVK